jgi:hypothetical protein
MSYTHYLECKIDNSNIIKHVEIKQMNQIQVFYNLVSFFPGWILLMFTDINSLSMIKVQSGVIEWSYLTDY